METNPAYAITGTMLECGSDVVPTWYCVATNIYIVMTIGEGGPNVERFPHRCFDSVEKLQIETAW